MDKTKELEGIPRIINEYKSYKTVKWMAAEINTTPHLMTPLTRSQLSNWANGTTKPPYYLMCFLAHKSTGWVKTMALEILATLRPDLWG